jgi:hypothetical protein
MVRMELPVQTAADLAQRPTAQIRAMALAVQANLVQLRVAEAKRRGIPAERHEIKVPAPGFVRDFRETLIDHHLLAAYPDVHVQLRLREVWGQFCVMLWVFFRDEPPERAGFADLPADAQVRCGTVVEAKHDEVHAILWLLRFEQRRRGDSDYARSAEFAEHQRLAAKIPGQAFGKPVADCTDDELVHAACEYAGMLAALRWIMGRVRNWGEEGCMQVAMRPF